MNKKFILIFLFLVSCTFSDDTSPKNTPMETTVITTAEGERSTNYLDYREIKLLRAATVTDETINFLNEYVEFSEKKLFSDPRLKFENIYPIIIAQLDSNNYQAAIDVETEYDLSVPHIKGRNYPRDLLNRGWKLVDVHPKNNDLKLFKK